MKVKKYEIWFMISDVEFFTGDWFYNKEFADCAVRELANREESYKRYFVKEV